MAVYVDTELCKSCKICISLCPKNVFEMTKHVNKKGYNYVETVREDECISCGQCQNRCPDFAICVE